MPSGKLLEDHLAGLRIAGRDTVPASVKELTFGLVHWLALWRQRALPGSKLTAGPAGCGLFAVSIPCKFNPGWGNSVPLPKIPIQN